MYHGGSGRDNVPGFPHHPHAGMETITTVFKGLCDHSDSLGSVGRFGNGDTQFMTAGAGLSHAEMFPMLHDEESGGENTLSLFQIWLNLPSKSKQAEPGYKMNWSEDTPAWTVPDANGREASVHPIVGQYADKPAPPPPPPASWAADPENEVALWTIEVPEGGTFTVPAAKRGDDINRKLFLYEGSASIDGKVFQVDTGVQVKASADVVIEANQGDGNGTCKLLLLQGRPINEPVVQHGPFVANSREGIAAIFEKYQRTRFGGWPHDVDGPVHGDLSVGRFAKYGDGTVEKKGQN